MSWNLPTTEKANVLSHLLGIIIGILTLPFLLVNGNWSLDLSVFAFAFLLMFTASTWYHMQTNDVKKIHLRKLDHISIFVLIAATYTPFLVRYLLHENGVILLVILWSCAMIGAILKLFFTGRFKLLSTILYLIMGWVALFSINSFLENIPTHILIWIGVGGLFYTIGTLFYMWKLITHHHAIWHLFVLAGALSHLWAIWLTT